VARVRLVVGALAAVVAAITLVVADVFDGDDGTRPVPPAAGQDGERIAEIYDRSRDAVLFIQAVIEQRQQSPFGPPRTRRGIATGTGFLIDENGQVVTNAHVVENATEVAIRVDANKLVPAELVGTDLANDLALLRVDPEAIDASPLPLGDSETLKVGDPVVALGNPLGLEDTITAGIVSAKHRRITAPNQLTIENVIQTDAAVNRGNSGGPLMDMEGRVIGVNSQIATAGQGATGFIGIAFAVPVETLKKVVPDLADDGHVDRPRLGVTAVTVTPELAAQLNLSVERGALLVGVAEGSPAADAGLRGSGTTIGALTGEGDVIVRVGERDINSSEELANAISDLRVGDTVEIGLIRDGERRTVEVDLREPAS